MSWDEVFKVVTITVGSLGGGAVIIVAFSSWLGKVWANRILETDKSRYSKELESLKLSHQDFINSQLLVNSTFFESKKVFVEKRISSVEQLWSDFITAKIEVPSAISFLDVLKFEEYCFFKEKSEFKSFKSTVDLHSISKLIPKGLNKHRPFLDDKTYLLVSGYFGIVARLCFYISKFYTDSQPNYDWREDSGVLRFINTVLTKEEESLFKSQCWTTAELMQFIETKIADHLRNLCSGEDLAKETLAFKVKSSKTISELYNIHQQKG
ncbi:hypothetical protein ATN50_01085 [Vibrio parahaemolyticus]|uniref:hypothetical protein n=1 Tax=Vibrio harveyi group TaxID=717610 RepID=UPI0004087FB6|nr:MULTISPECIES: hypothetical protein [Vibrio harveyi group]EKO3838652.1 hypothetical protein [Vibrio harveyi]EGQ7779533.1 hypothetical protein [Vibrio parahaemolyticus]EGQ8400013.1 hypothetical protein [Vibrio parahaemolyticus]EGQ9050372.1 hypothetical protein [Vibrio parahaemolyticus]EGQ9147190.1 hypothetical protein [Vibrio parahaemolyticus]